MRVIYHYAEGRLILIFTEKQFRMQDITERTALKNGDVRAATGYRMTAYTRDEDTCRPIKEVGMTDANTIIQLII
jgi:hypothetical protein